MFVAGPAALQAHRLSAVGHLGTSRDGRCAPCSRVWSKITGKVCGSPRAPELRNVGPHRSTAICVTREEVLGLTLALIRTGDAELVNEDRCLPKEVCAPADRPKVRRAVAILSDVVHEYDYTASQEFQAANQGKSPAYEQMRRKLESDPVKRSERLERLEAALRNLLASDDAYELIPSDKRKALDEVRELIGALSG